MSDIVLSASVRQNLLSLQQTASLLATTQNDLATGNKVNSALDNPTNFFTAQSLNNRASDINNLLDAIGNGVQVLQAANTGITSLQSLVSSAQSIANQVLQSPVGYSAKSSFTVAIAGGTAQDLLGTGGGFTDATFAGGVETANTLTAFTDNSANGAIVDNNLNAPAPVTTATKLLSAANSDTLATTPVNGSQLDVNGATITFSTATTTNVQSGNNWTIGVGAGSTQTIGTVLSDIDAITGNTGTASTVNGSGELVIHTGTANNVSFAGSSASILTDLGLTGVGPITRGGGAGTTTALAGSTLLSGTASPTNSVLAAQFVAGDTITVDGNVLTFVSSGASSANEINVTDNVTTLLAKIDALSGNTGTASSISGGAITLHTGTAASQLTVTTSDTAALTALGLGASVTQAAGGAQPNLQGKTLTIGATGGGTATSITFGTGANQVESLNDLNNALVANNLQATIDSQGNLTIVTSNDAASSTIGGIGGTAAGVGFAFHGAAASAPVEDAASQLTRANLVSQYNNVLQQIDTTSQDSSFNGINLLNGDTLKLTFDETGKSTLSITGVTFNDAGLGLSSLTAGTDFLDTSSANHVLASLDTAQSTLRSEASTLGSNLSIVQIRQDFNKNLINVLQTGSSNLTLADPNEEAADSQALSTRQSIAVSALALANQSQQSVLQLLR